MRYYPIFFKVEGRAVLVVGGGEVGARKVENLLRCGARVGVVSPALVPWLEEKVREGTVELVGSEYDERQLHGRSVVIAATDDGELNTRVASDAERRNLLCNVVDLPSEGNFIVPAVMRRGSLTLAISTDGQSPALARKIREELEERYGKEYGDLLHLLGAVRARLLSTSKDSRLNKDRFERLVRSPLLELVRRRDRDGIERILQEVFGEGYSLKELEISW
jgi:precorrin-2 dehydrogenase/sirohydrochlorin ferrochelatase